MQIIHTHYRYYYCQKFKLNRQKPAKLEASFLEADRKICFEAKFDLRISPVK